MASLIFDLGRRCRWVANFVYRPLLLLGKKNPIPSDQEAAWAPEQAWTF